MYRRWRTSPSPQLRIQAARVLRGLPGPTARVALYSLLEDAHVAVRAAARGELIARPDAEIAPMATEVSALRDPGARVEGLRVLLARGADPTPFVHDPAPRVRVRALASGRIAPGAVPDTALSADALTKSFAIEVRADPELAHRFVRDRDESVRIAVARVATNPDVISTLLRDRSWRVQLAAVLRSERRRDKAAVRDLVELLGRARGRLRARTRRALESLTHADFGSDVARWRAWWAANGGSFEVPPLRAAPPASHTKSVLSFRRLPVDSDRLCFVLDGSRSMEKPAPGKNGRTRWQLVVADVEAVIDRLPTSARFNILVFQTEVHAWKSRLARATPGARNAARRWIRSLRPSGWTNLFDALAHALQDDQLDTMFLLTDGVPSRGAETTRREILAEIALLNRYRMVRINCVQAGATEGLGKRWHGFLDELAQANNGLSVRE